VLFSKNYTYPSERLVANWPLRKDDLRLVWLLMPALQTLNKNKLFSGTLSYAIKSQVMIEN
jgi:hypothetical protein